ncbi:MAG: hypothetical protein JXR14_14460 [Paracoccaceae bacterium]
MEQLKDPKSLIAATSFRHRPNMGLPARLAEVQPSKSFLAWTRLSEVYLDPRELRRQKVHGLEPESALPQVDILRTKTLNYMRAHGFRRLGIASPRRQCGKTTIAANLSLSFARQRDLRTMLFDLDLTNPGLAVRLGLQTRGPKFSALEYCRRDFDTLCLRAGHNLALSLATTPSESCAELLAARHTRDLLESIETDFEPDIMLFDMPALLDGDAGLAMLDLVDAVFIVARADQTTDQDLILSEQLLSERTNCIGTILNKCRFVPSGS